MVSISIANMGTEDTLRDERKPQHSRYSLINSAAEPFSSPRGHWVARVSHEIDRTDQYPTNKSQPSPVCKLFRI